MKELKAPSGSQTYIQQELEKGDVEESQRWRKSLEEEILAMSSMLNKYIPPSHLLIIDPTGIDNTMLRLILDGHEPLTDDLFFSLLQESPKYLMYEPFQEKIALWQDLLHDPFVDKTVHSMAGDRLKRIGETLAFVGSGRKQPDFGPVYLEYVQLIEMLEPFILEGKGLTQERLEKLFNERFPFLSEYAIDPFSRTPVELAKEILCSKYKVRVRTLEMAISREKNMYARTRAISEQNDK